MASVCRRESLCLIVPDSQSQEVRHVSSDGRQRLSQIIEYLPVPESLPENYLLLVWCRASGKSLGIERERERGSSGRLERQSVWNSSKPL